MESPELTEARAEIAHLNGMLRAAVGALREIESLSRYHVAGFPVACRDIQARAREALVAVDAR